MKAIRFRQYGAPDVLEYEDVATPSPGDDEVLVRVRASSVNPMEAHFVRGEPYVVRAMLGLRWPRSAGLGADLAGEVEAVGKNVTNFATGDQVFGYGEGTFAEYVTMRGDGVLLTKPANLTFEQAGAVGVAGFSALQALRDKGNVQAGQQVLVNGAAGGIGTFAVQLAKSFGAEVTGVCGTRNVELVTSIGADHVVDYTKDDFTAGERRYDLVIDLAGSRTVAEIRRVLAPKGVLVAVGGPIRGMWLSPVTGPLSLVLRSLFVSQSLKPFLTRKSRDDLAVLRELMENGKVTPVIDRTYPLDEVPDALRYLEEGHARGKVVITV